MLIAHNAKGKPELRPTFNVAGQRVERILKPGDRIGAGLDNGLGHIDGTGAPTCSCGDCKTFHEQLTRLGPAGGDDAERRKPSGQAMREWAAEVGIDCPKTGRVPARVAEAYAAAHN